MRIKSLEEAVAIVKAKGWTNVSVIKRPMQRSFLIARTDCPHCWDYDGAKVYWSN